MRSLPSRCPALAGAARALALAALLAVAPDARAQRLDVLEKRLDAALAQLQAAERDAEVYKAREQKKEAAMESVEVGPVRMLISPGNSAEGRAALAAALARIERRFGPVDDLIAKSLAGEALVATRATARSVRAGWFGPAPRERHWYHISYQGTYGWPMTYPSGAPTLSEELDRYLTHVVVNSHPKELRDWVTIIPTRIESDHAWALRRIDLVSARSAAARRCAGGNVKACSLALGAVSVNDPLMELHDAAGRRELVRDRLYHSRQVSVSSADRCVAGDDESCIFVLRRLGWSQGWLSSDLQSSLVEEALAAGGAGAFQRLVRTAGPPVARLEAAAGMPIDALVTRWRERIFAAPGVSSTMTPVIAGISMVWMLVFAALSLRSSRWR